MSKKKKRVKARNPFADAIRMNPIFREKKCKSDEQKAEHRDVWSRKSKYKGAVIEVDGD